MMLSARLILLFMAHVVYLRCAVLTHDRSRDRSTLGPRSGQHTEHQDTPSPIPHDHVLTGGSGTTLSCSVVRNLEQRLQLDIADG
jgi:hypothetical protein